MMKGQESSKGQGRPPTRRIGPALVGVAALVAGCSTWGSGLGNSGLTSAIVTLDLAGADRALQTILGTATNWDIAVYTDNNSTPQTLVGSSNDNAIGTLTKVVDLLPADRTLDFDITVQNGSTTVGRGLAQATLSSTNAANAVNITTYANGGDLTGATLSGSVAQSSSALVVSARFLIHKDYFYRFTPAMGSDCTVASIASGREGAVLPGTGTSNSGAFTLNPIANLGASANEFYDVRVTFQGASCGSGDNKEIQAERVASASITID
jgi:hypothetical protein